MNRRRFSHWSLALIAGQLLVLSDHAKALAQSDLSNAQASQGFKLALEKGALFALGSLGQSNGFMGNDKVRIPLPGFLQDAAQLLRTFGQGARLDELIVAMNRAAEAAVPLSKALLLGAVKSMTIEDAKNILSAGPTSVTQFFAEKTRQPLSQKFLPIVVKTTAQVGLAQQYNQLADKASGLGLLKGDEVSVERYVTAKTLDSLYFMIGEEEKKIRQDPLSSGSAVLQKVFGDLR
jgi:hypothetical protein